MSGVVAITPFLSIATLVMTLWGDRIPSDSEFWFFISAFWLWLCVTSAFLACAAILQSIDAGWSVEFRQYLTIGVSVALMKVRLGEAIRYFPEWYLMAVAAGVLLLMHLAQGHGRKKMALAGESNNYSAGNTDGDTAIRFRATKPRYKFADVVGMAEVKARLLEAGQDVVRSRKSGQSARNGILLTGLPGNGKTFMAEALAGELKLPIMTVTFGSVASKWVNNTTEHVVQAFRDAARQAPCVLFIDEIDSMLSERTGGSSSDESEKTTNTLLTELVDIRRTGVLVIGASNFVDRLDPAAIREGRFDFKVEIAAPDSEARRHLITRKSKKAISQETIDTAVRRWEGFSVARITAIMEEAGRTASPAISFDALQKALRVIQGRKGKLPEDTPTIDQLTMGAENKQRLQSLAHRMDRIMEIESMGGSVPRGVLFYGPPGTGKTLTARALAKSAHWAFISVSGMDLITDPKRIDSVVAEASELRPCIVFIDEADDVFRDRRYSQSATVTNKLLAALDGSGGKIPDVLFIAATNHPDEMDSAALRGGRFTEKILFALPDQDTLTEYLHQWASSTKAKLAESFNFQTAACRLEGNSMANVNEILKMAINNAIARMDATDGFVVVNMKNLDAAIASIEIA